MKTRETQIRAEPARRAATAGNERLTAMTVAVLLVLFVAECLPLLNIGNLLTLHVFLGMLLLGPAGLKIGSTLWRFTRYYTGSAGYVRKGPPGPLQRVTGPFVILTTVAVLGTGIMLVVEGPGNGSWGRLHHLSFFLWAVVIVIHLASYVPKLPRMLSGRVDHARRPGHALAAAGRFPGRRTGAGVRHLSPLGQIWRLAQHHPVNQVPGRLSGRLAWPRPWTGGCGASGGGVRGAAPGREYRRIMPQSG